MHQLVDSLHLLPELGVHAAIKLTAARHMKLQRIGEAAVDEHLIMQMRSGREAGGADLADQFTLPDFHAFFMPARTAHMAVGVLISVSHDDRI